MTDPDFPKNFIFGAATSAYQIEGGWDADGKGPSIWDEFAHRKGKIHGDHHGDTACETYVDFQTDIDIMRELGLQAYRFSVSWPRVLPNGRGAVNEAGLDYYDRLVDGLLEAGITPFVTLFHWDMPLALEREIGGFSSRDCAFLFADYAALVSRRLGDRVKDWITLNEPWVHAALGYLRGLHAPGRLNPRNYLRVVHHQLLGHGLATQRLRDEFPEASIGISLNLSPAYPASSSTQDKAVTSLADQFVNQVFLDALYKGTYPQPLWRKLRYFHPPVQSGDMSIISQPLDFLGINYYTRIVMKHAWYVPIVNALPVNFQYSQRFDFANGRKTTLTNMGWEVYPAGLFELLTRIKKDYNNPPVFITENGAAYPDVVENGRIHDIDRQAYLEQHLAVVAAALRVGVDVRGYFAWSLLDNFEWAYGYDKRFGIIHVDFKTQERTVKDSGYWYRDLIATRNLLPISVVADPR